MATKINRNNIQGDILGKGLPKKVETFIFFQITNAKNFIQHLKELAPLITTVEQVVKDRDDIDKHKKLGKGGLIVLTGVNIALSYTGLCALGISDEKMASLLKDNCVFKSGAVSDAPSLNDPMDGDKPAWYSDFLKQIDGVILVTGNSEKTAKEKINEVLQTFGHGAKHSSMHIIRIDDGAVRPGDQKGHEHFGFRDCISIPHVIDPDHGHDLPLYPDVPGPAPVDAKFMLTGYNGAQPDWTADGSFLVFRYFLQQVPEFDSFLKKNAVKNHPETSADLSNEMGSELLGARLVGRWKSGAPIDITPFDDDKCLAKDPKRNNDFSFANEFRDMYKCPWAAHVRRTNPRADTTRKGEDLLNNRKIARRSIPFGPEVTQEEKEKGVTKHERGLLFVCYQANIETAFRFIQQKWSNNPVFPFINGDIASSTVPGLDPLTGQAGQDTTRNIIGYDPITANDILQKPLSMPDFVIPRGAGYFWSPPIKALFKIDEWVTTD